MNIKKLRLKNKLTQGEVAKFLNIGQTTYSHYETGRNEPNIEILIKLSNLYKISIDEIVGNKIPQEIDLTNLSEDKRNLIFKIQNLDDNTINSLNAFLEGLIYAKRERQDIINQIKKYRGE